ncbi:hypothetical protein [Chitinophaga sp. CF418]|uniref:hypothetical protein n=1 Tax=Chitinophaga sp. CF418 TaxID=1855287 RepID=UPI000911B86F|nr:hypothetical protein [Chitinophaga sp. CF418]SHN13313.1 hypothetical protein SAMN05216311_105380 [Chitinophaga sp. CF418]
MKYEPSVDANISEQEKAFRAFVSNDPALSYFLETGSMLKNKRFSKEEIYNDPAFLTFISPYFQDVYVKAIFRSFDLKDTNLMSDVAVNRILLDDAHKKQAFDQIMAYLEERKAKLVSLSNKLHLGEAISLLDLSEYTGIMTIANLNYLPVEFKEFRTAYAREILKVVRWLVSRDFPAALNMATDLRQLKCDAQTTYDADALYQQLENASQKASAVEGLSSGGGEMSTGKVVATIIGIILFIIKLILLFAD